MSSTISSWGDNSTWLKTTIEQEFLEHNHAKKSLLIVSRLAVILTATVLTIGVLAIILQRFGINLGLSISLFPIVIFTMLIERAALSWEESGTKETIIAAIGTVFVAVIG